MSDDFDAFTGRPFRFSGDAQRERERRTDEWIIEAQARFSSVADLMPQPKRSPAPQPVAVAERVSAEKHLDDQIARAVEKDELERTLAAAARALAEAKLREVAGDKIAGARALLQEHRQHCKNYSLRKNAPVRYCATCRAFEHTVELVEKENGT